MMDREKKRLFTGCEQAEHKDDGRSVERYETAIGAVKVCRDLPYPCVPESVAEEKDGKIRRIVTASHSFRLHGAQTAELAPVVYQSCMHPEQIRIYPVELDFTDGEISFRIRGQQWKIQEKESGSVEIFDWKPKLEKKSCIPCTNCGKCSW